MSDAPPADAGAAVSITDNAIAPRGPVWVVGDATGGPADATHVARVDDVPWASLPPGTQVRLAPGDYPGLLTLRGVQGSATAPVQLTALDATQPPRFANSIDVQASGWLQISRLVISAPTYAGVIVRQASHHITLAGLQIHGGANGINITDGAGTGLRLLGNHIDHSLYSGINIEVNSDAVERGLVQGNVVSDSGHHGIEVRASHWRIEHNTVTRSGQAIGGTSGIHLYSAGPDEDSGDDNQVLWNDSYANADTTESDGNGIEADQFCDGNLIAFNATWANDGAGILVYNARDNRVENNTARDNGRWRGSLHGPSAEIMVGVSALNRSAGNVLRNNIAQSLRPGWPAFYINTGALALGNQVGPNLFHHAVAGEVPVRWGDALNLRTAAELDTATGIGGHLVEAPQFMDTAQPLAGGLRLARAPSANGEPRVGAVDKASISGVAGMGWWGAWFLQP